MRIEALMGDQWRFRTARNAIPILVEYARRRPPRRITYGELDAEIQRRGWGEHCFLTVYGYAAGKVAEACHEYAKSKRIKMPPLNVLVVNNGSKIPGAGADYHLERYLELREGSSRNWDDDKRRCLYEKAINDVSHYRGWDRFLADLGYESKGSRPVTVWDRSDRVGAGRNRDGKPSPAHDRVVEAVKKKPALVGLAGWMMGEPEYEVPSKDRIDLFFKAANTAVECKPRDAGNDDLERGVYQCIKYRAVLNAELRAQNEVADAVCFLALGGRAPRKIKRLARKLKVKIYENLDPNKRRK